MPKCAVLWVIFMYFFAKCILLLALLFLQLHRLNLCFWQKNGAEERERNMFESPIKRALSLAYYEEKRGSRNRAKRSTLKRMDALKSRGSERESWRMYNSHQVQSMLEKKSCGKPNFSVNLYSLPLFIFYGTLLFPKIGARLKYL